VLGGSILLVAILFRIFLVLRQVIKTFMERKHFLLRELGVRFRDGQLMFVV